jgi:hypothetical protein
VTDFSILVIPSLGIATVCKVIPINGPMHQCKNGHIVCNLCKPQLLNNLCPTCRDPIVGRAMNIEKLLLELAPRPCKFSQSGCTIELVPSLLRKHENDCETKLLHCPNILCSTKILPKYLDEHLKKSESCKAEVIDRDMLTRLIVFFDDSFINKRQTWDYNRINQYGQVFFTETVRTLDGNWILWLYFLGSENEAKKYFYTITICHSDKRLQSSFSGQVTSMRQDPEDIFKRPNGLYLCDEMVKTYLEDNRLKFKITLLMPVNQKKITHPRSTIDAQKQKRKRT